AGPAPARRRESLTGRNRRNPPDVGGSSEEVQMTNALSWMPLDIARDLGWTLIHFVWQGLLLAALLHVLLPFCRHAAQRHNCALGVLALMLAAPVATFLSLHDFST